MKFNKKTMVIGICFITAILFIINGIIKKDAIYFILGCCWICIGIDNLRRKEK